MRAMRVDHFGGLQTMQLDDIMQPVPHGDEVLINVAVASVNRVDMKMREGNYPAVTEEDLPYVPGRDVSGTVEPSGEKASAFLPGTDALASLAPERGGDQEFVIARAGEVAAKPRSLDHVCAAGVPLARITAWQGLFDHGRLQAGQRVRIHGGAGGPGHFAVQFAKTKGAWVATTVSEADRGFVAHLGADEVIDYRWERLENSIEPVDLVFELISGERCFSAIRPGGAMISTLSEEAG